MARRRNVHRVNIRPDVSGTDLQYIVPFLQLQMSPISGGYLNAAPVGSGTNFANWHPSPGPW
jgi:hypothetical protein